MDKKTMLGLIAVIIIALIGLGIYFSFSNNTIKKSSNNSLVNENQDNEEEKDDKTQISDGKILVVYYSATGSTKQVAEEISRNLNADLFEIVPVDIYTSDDLDWTNNNSRVSKEHNDESLRNVKLKNTKVDNWESYDTVLIGYPIWWGIAAWPINTFVKANDFNNKTIIPFCTSASSDLGQSGDLLEKEANAGNWKEGYRFNSNASSSSIKTWTDSLK